MIKILSTKILSKNSIKKLEKNFKIFEHNFLDISFCLDEKKINFLKNSEQIFIFTSQYSIISPLTPLLRSNFKSSRASTPVSVILQEEGKKIKCFAIEGKTSELAKKNGFEILATGKNSLDLAKKITKLLKKENNLVYLTTKNHRKEMGNYLKEKGINLEIINIYEKKLNPKKIKENYDAILFFSPSQIDSFFLKNFLDEKVVVFCIGETTKNYFLEKIQTHPLSGTSLEKGRKNKYKIIVSQKSSEESLVEEIFNYYKINKKIMSKSEETIKIFFEILETFPTSHNGQKYLRLKNNKKLYFNLFLRKYGLYGNQCNYNNKDILRRIRMIEFFKYITQNYDIINGDKKRFFIETNFFRMVIIETKKNKLELLSFYNFR